MARFNQILVLGALSLLTLAGCDIFQEDSTPKTSSSAVPGTGVKTDKATTPLKYPELSGLVFYTKKAVEADNFPKAKTEFGKFENAWKKVENGMKTKAPTGYNAVKEATAKVTTEFKKSEPSKDKVLAQLDLLDKTIKTFPKS
ncbi:MAG: hypothetical protein QQW96_23530 [Tychonema bourrellyi B0820]|uniref:DUF4363 domain-containing protein n=1 Tax=Tychonema bourrellyi FEM_GT703 TaxID=2040638 RepID=A0A2G4EUK2_9CYAN|nr:DUF4363 domain-containing protein [Tychonema bourrellyi]MDQ2100604.1 hypothetical protein [Tychonema bourrellyi B0820]PHX53168.1 DUF4363 domain-containing protein [Tychonema bourrellyi FEM_GT703]